MITLLSERVKRTILRVESEAKGFGVAAKKKWSFFLELVPWRPCRQKRGFRVGGGGGMRVGMVRWRVRGGDQEMVLHSAVYTPTVISRGRLIDQLLKKTVKLYPR